MFRTSEFWIGIATAAGAGLVAVGVLPQETWDKVLFPAIVYVVGRLTSKAVKAV